MSKTLSSVLLLAMATTAYAADVTCKVVAISDGDTFTCLTDARQQIKIRMAEIDAPEKDQPYGQKAKNSLSDLAFGKLARLDVQETDRYGRSVARVYVGSTDVNTELVKQGAVWVYRQYNRDKSLIPLEDQAKATKRGLWALPEDQRIPPWDWRKARRNQATGEPKKPTSPPQTSNASAFSCSVRKTCGQMTSCAEARYHLTECGNTRLDRDGDGVPCESLCR